ncbi:MAG: hypothetical protein HC804_14595 [Anaerolineae bacterium]|nr:hypothetical protein [Anaerolineae bacterium]
MAAYQAILDGLSDTRSLPQFTPRYETSNGGTAGLNRMGPLAVGADGRTLYGYSHIIGVRRWQICPEQADGLCAAAGGDGVFGEAVVEVALSDQSRVFSANGGWLAATTDEEALARIWQLPTEEATAVLATTLTLADAADVVLSLSDDGRWLVVKSGANLQLWDAAQGVLAGQLTPADTTLAAGAGQTAAVSADGRWWAALFQEPGNTNRHSSSPK